MCRFAVAGPAMWNNLLKCMSSIGLLAAFRKQLKPLLHYDTLMTLVSN